MTSIPDPVATPPAAAQPLAMPVTASDTTSSAAGGHIRTKKLPPVAPTAAVKPATAAHEPPKKSLHVLTKRRRMDSGVALNVTVRKRHHVQPAELQQERTFVEKGTSAEYDDDNDDAQCAPTARRRRGCFRPLACLSLLLVASFLASAVLWCPSFDDRAGKEARALARECRAIMGEMLESARAFVLSLPPPAEWKDASLAFVATCSQESLLNALCWCFLGAGFLNLVKFKRDHLKVSKQPMGVGPLLSLLGDVSVCALAYCAFLWAWWDLNTDPPS